MTSETNDNKNCAISQNFAEIDEVIDDDPKLAYQKLKEIYDSNEEMKTSVDLLWRLGKACFLWANTLQKKDSKKKLLIFEGRKYATSAYENDENNADALRWAAILIGSATDFLGAKEKIEQGKIFKLYLDRAIEMQPTDYSLLHSRGRFSYEVANLSWIEKRLCSALFSEVPSGTIDQALSDFLEAEKCSQFEWPENLLYIARCYALLKNKELAKKYLERVEMIEQLDEAEAEALVEVRAVVSKLK
uniref:Regulator of microtubule dynamics protein 2 n=1 Tax=Elaeophora elaphi TaxID=1147741 RepID=A0A0R3RI80_9BILA